MPLELDYEAAARKLCSLRGVNPNAMVNYRYPSGDTNPRQVPAWRNAEEEVRSHKAIQDSMNGCWVEKRIAGVPTSTVAPVPEPEDDDLV